MIVLKTRKKLLEEFAKTCIVVGVAISLGAVATMVTSPETRAEVLNYSAVAQTK